MNTFIAITSLPVKFSIKLFFGFQPGTIQGKSMPERKNIPAESRSPVEKIRFKRFYRFYKNKGGTELLQPLVFYGMRAILRQGKGRV